LSQEALSLPLSNFLLNQTPRYRHTEGKGRMDLLDFYSRSDDLILRILLSFLLSFCWYTFSPFLTCSALCFLHGIGILEFKYSDASTIRLLTVQSWQFGMRQFNLNWHSNVGKKFIIIYYWDFIVQLEWPKPLQTV